MTFATFLLIAGLGVIATYITGIQYLKSLRNQTNKKVTSLTLISTSLICGGPIVLFLYCMFSEIRNQDRMLEKNKMLISEIIISCVQITVIVLLFVFQIITIDL